MIAGTEPYRNDSVRTQAGPGGRVWRDLREITEDLGKYRFLLLQLTLRDIKVRHKQAVMGFFWAVSMPAMIVLAGLLVKFAMARLSGGTVDASAAGSLAVKALPWAFFIGALQFSLASLVGNQNLITKIYFPREVLPLSAVLAQIVDTGIGALVLLLVLPLLGLHMSLALLWVPLLALVLLLITTAAALFFSCANLFFRDVKYIVQVLLMFGIFFTPVFFEPVMFGATGARLMMYNPIAPVLEGLRWSMIEGRNLLHPIWSATEPGSAVFLVWHPGYLLYSLGFGVVALLLAALLFHRSEQLFAEYA